MEYLEEYKTEILT